MPAAGDTPRSRFDLLARMRAGGDLDLGDHDPGETFGWEKEQAQAAVKEEVEAVAELQTRLFAERERALLVVLPAMDAGGKDGLIRTVFTGINPAGVRVSSPRTTCGGSTRRARLGAISACSTAATTRTSSSCG
jgi:hypothetical protein